jgi:hypothetical protein
MIYDCIISFENSEDDHFFAIEMRLDKPTPSSVYPWDFVNELLQLVDTPYPFMVKSQRPIDYSFATGQFYSQIAWVNGFRTKFGIYNADYFRMPVIPLIFLEQDTRLALTSKYLNNSAYFLGLANILQFCMGKDTGVYFQVPPSNSYMLFEYTK